jgi:hypothetical protein
MKHLWEVKHPYYCNEGLYFGTGHSGPVDDDFRSFAEFLEAHKDSDLDMNLVFRWDWHEGPDYDLPEFNGDVYYRNGELKIFWMMQRKGFHRWSTIQVCRADEPLVIEFLQRRWAHLQRLWEPIAVADKGGLDGADYSKG